MVASGKFVGSVSQRGMEHLDIGPMPLLLEAAYSNPLEEVVFYPILGEGEKILKCAGFRS
jgi:hypothetical protein